MRYIISPSQFHSLVYRYLTEIFSKEDFRNYKNPHVEDGSVWRVEIHTDDGERSMSYFWYGPGEDDDGNLHNGMGSLYIDSNLVDNLRINLNVRESKIIDILADWVSEKLNVEIDEVGITREPGNRSVY